MQVGSLDKWSELNSIGGSGGNRIVTGIQMKTEATVMDNVVYVRNPIAGENNETIY